MMKKKTMEKKDPQPFLFARPLQRVIPPPLKRTKKWPLLKKYMCASTRKMTVFLLTLP